MKKKIIINKGEKFNKLTVTSVFKGENNLLYCKCICDCGNEKVALKSNIIKGKTKSCGCLYKESRKFASKKHGDRQQRLYSIWTNIKTRCENSKVPSFNVYGGRGISLCEEWHEYEKFKEWAIKNGYGEKLTIDRIDSQGNYEPNNCRWVDRFAQARNKRDNINIEIDGEMKCLKEWCEIYNLKYKVVHQRMIRRSDKLTAKENLLWYIEKLILEGENK